MPSRTFFKERYFMLILAISIVAGGVVASAAIMYGYDFDTFFTQGFRVGEARIKADNEVVIVVNQIAITYPEFVEYKLRFTTNLSTMKRQIEKSNAIRPQTMHHSEDATPNPSAEAEHILAPESFVGLVRVMENHGADAGALGAIIMDYAQYSAAVQAGHAVSDAEMMMHVSEIRGIYEQQVSASHADAKIIGEMEGYIKAAGEDKYWNEIYPDDVRKRLTIGKWQQSAVSGIEDSGGAVSLNDMNKIFAELEASALENADVIIVDDSNLNATLHEGMEYIRDYKSQLYGNYGQEQ